MILANRLTLPDNTSALLWDMDGVLIDSLTFDYEICNQMLRSHFGADVGVARTMIRELFPFDPYEFWRRILEKTGIDSEKRDASLPGLVENYEAARQVAKFSLNPGIEELLDAARQQELKLAVVSNNHTEHVKEILYRNDLARFFDEVVGNDIEHIAKKPSPDAYLLATRILGVNPAQCVVIEDSLLGAQAGRAAGCYTVGVATGAETFERLDTSNLVDRAYTSFEERAVQFVSGAVTEKRIATPNEFVSHMIEHLAWRLGCSVTVYWNNSDWVSLGQAVGNALVKFPRRANAAAVIGMIDDGSAEIRITVAENSEVLLKGTAQVDLDWFLASRCEQLSSGRPLVELLKGIATAFPLDIEITVCNFEDPHHTWEGIFRSVGIALNRLLLTNSPAVETTIVAKVAPEVSSGENHWTLLRDSLMVVELLRKTAESEVRVLLDFSCSGPPRCHFEVADSIQVDGLTDLLGELTHHAHCQLELEFKATRINSSHVVMEDTGMVIGRALKTILVRRMWSSGINGAGSSVATLDDLNQSSVGVGLSIEGRKFWTFVPFYANHEEFRRQFLIGHTVGRGLFSEDLDDFIDGFAGGISGSIVVHVRHPITPQEGWPLIFRGLGKAIADALAPNPARKGVPPGVKATLA
ncbi:phosphoglycolate phosphatase [Gammaproteobacteria bacterium]